MREYKKIADVVYFLQHHNKNMTKEQKATRLYLKLSDACYKLGKKTKWDMDQENREIFDTLCESIQFFFDLSKEGKCTAQK